MTDNMIKDNIDNVLAHLAAANSPLDYNKDMPFAVLHNNTKVVDMEKYMDRPSHVRKEITFTDIESFTSYYHMFKKGYEPRVFSIDNPYEIDMMAVLDYDKVEDAGTKPSWCSNVIKLSLAQHPDFAFFLNTSGERHTQEDFALLVEQYTSLFTEPDGATMLEIAQDLRGSKSANWKAGKRLANGQVSIEYTEEVNAQTRRGDILVPEYVTIRTPMFLGGEPIDLRMAFSYRLNDGKIQFSFRLLAREAIREEIARIKDDISKKLDAHVFNVSGFHGIITE